ncbi:MAG: heavy metal translocating P-type ATPase [Gammaproteobacteria bacterium]|nr:heavy metal translocating P-type ATPase [Gammaproteobacteria bacterium]MBU1724024.1 heavy metal translocating P-type ATPase [Gammaproteobacteria bacterium]MBU2006907.1 heavy metal translocating P-type ATPase [Gammaproteobacteria bacterium]
MTDNSLHVESSDCFHCGQPIPAGAHYRVAIDGSKRDMCCTGCQAVATAIVENNLTDYYRFRTTIGDKPEDLVPEALRKLQVYDSPELQKSFVRDTDGNTREASLILEGIVCAACVWLNEHHVKQLPGVIDFGINYSTHRATLKWDNNIIHLSDVLKAISEIGYHAHPFDPGRLESLQKKEKSAALRRIAVAGLGMMQVMMIAVAMYIGVASDMETGMRDFLRWISLVMTTPVVFYSARVFFASAWRDLRRGRFGMDVPVSLAIGIAYSASVWATITGGGEVYFDSVSMFTFFLLSGRYLEMAARHKAGQVAEELVRLMPATATRLRDGEQEVVPVSQLEPGDLLLVRPGEVVPADGLVTDGVSSTNESLLTGESLPCRKQPGDALVGGTLNIESPLTMQVDKVGDNTVLASIIRLLERAQAEKPELARLAEKVASRFVPIILLIAAGVFAWWYQHDPSQAFWIALSVLVITCPCAFSLATPAALTAATGLLTSRGVLTTRGHALETLARINHIIFDKTGTLSHGQLEVVDFQTLGNATASFCKHIAAGLETASEHPVAHAIAGLSDSPARVSNLTAESGRGVKGIYQQKRYRIGTESFVRELTGTALPEMRRGSDRSEVFLGSEDGWLACISLADRLREEAGSVVQELRSLGVDVTLLSGDTPEMVNTVAQQLDIPHAHGGQLPDGKLAYLRGLQEQGAVVAMVGDGVNDAPVLAGAQVSIAMGSGSQLAQASADMVLLSENLHQLPFSIQTARRMQAIIKQNFAWTILYNLLAIPLAASGLIAPWMAAIGMSASSLIVVLNALRLKS